MLENYINFCVIFLLRMETVFQRGDVFRNRKPRVHPRGGKGAVVYKN